jgi:hypothetical protein
MSQPNAETILAFTEIGLGLERKEINAVGLFKKCVKTSIEITAMGGVRKPNPKYGGTIEEGMNMNAVLKASAFYVMTSFQRFRYKVHDHSSRGRKTRQGEA